MRKVFTFPNPVNEVAARVVAGGVVLQGVAFLLVRQWWLLAPLVYGFLARVLTGPTLSPLGQFATRVAAPRLPGTARLVAGPPKRFAQGIGLVFSAGALAASALGASSAATVLIAALVMAATLESVFALCLGCIAFNRLMRWGLVPADVCADCADISGRLTASLATR
jgi:Domain of unknown function (DUF4395)